MQNEKYTIIALSELEKLESLFAECYMAVKHIRTHATDVFTLEGREKKHEPTARHALPQPSLDELSDVF